MGLLTDLLNPKVAALYLSLLPQFVDRGQGSVLVQTLSLGSTQIVISVAMNAAIVTTAGSIAAFLTGRPLWARLQRDQIHLFGEGRGWLPTRGILYTHRSL